MKQLLQIKDKRFHNLVLSVYNNYSNLNTSQIITLNILEKMADPDNDQEAFIRFATKLLKNMINE